MSAVALEHAYRYATPSNLRNEAGAARLRLATSGGEEEHPYFFQGRLTAPRQTADLLQGLMEIVHARFHIPANSLAKIIALADPVVTSNDGRLRFEGFSGCASAYARVDLLPGAVEGQIVGRGTTNVDFNAPMLAALSGIRDSDRVELSVGSREVRLARGAGSVVERKVPLPVRWLKGFVEVQAYQSRMVPVLEVSGLEAQRFLRGLPRGRSKHPCWVVPRGRGLRLSSTSQAEGVRVAGIERLRVLEKLARHAKSLRVFAERETGTAALELLLETARFHLVLSPDVWRGFSGEGQALATLAGTKWQAALARVRAALRWETIVDLDALATRTRLTHDSLQAALSALGARGLVGFDLEESSYFHRELPFDLSAIEAHQPRLKAARKLLDAGQVRIHRRSKEECELYVAGTQVEHRVRLSASADEARCTCPWFSKYQGTRGPCKHILAVQMFLDATPETGER